MANKRDFKKSVEEIGAGLCSQILALGDYTEGMNQDVVDDCVDKIIAAIYSAKDNANLFFDRKVKEFANLQEYNKEKSRFFKKLFEKISSDFFAVVDEALKEFNAALPEGVKAQNKEAAK